MTQEKTFNVQVTLKNKGPSQSDDQFLNWMNGCLNVSVQPSHLDPSANP